MEQKLTFKPVYNNYKLVINEGEFSPKELIIQQVSYKIFHVAQQGEAGVGVPLGGTTGQVLAKASNDDLDTGWVNQSGGGGSVNSVIAGTNISIDNTDPANPIINSLSDKYKTNSTTSNTIVSTGSLTFTVDANLAYIPQQEVIIVYDSSNHMHATITSYSGTTLIVDVRHKTGAGTYSAWVINLDGTPVDAITGSGTANQIAYFLSSTAIASLPTATYPNLTELSYLKGITNNVQNQINGRVPYSGATSDVDLNGVNLTNIALSEADTAQINNMLMFGQYDELRLSSDQHNVYIDKSLLYVDPSTDGLYLTGCFTGYEDSTNPVLIIQNSGSRDFSIANESVESVDIARFDLPNGTDLLLKPKEGALFIYNRITTRWNCVAKLGGSVAWGDITGDINNQSDLQTALSQQEELSIAYAVAL
jgi:hypothetical protein